MVELLIFTNCEGIADAMRLNHCQLLFGCVDWVIVTTVQLVVILRHFLSVGHVEEMQACLFVCLFYLKIVQHSVQKCQDLMFQVV